MMRLHVGMAVVLALAPAAVLATPTIKADFEKHYNIKASSKIGKAGCNVCHAALPKLNPFGEDIKKAQDKLKTNKKMTPAVYAAIEKLDSAKSGMTNLAKIKADCLPGDPKDKPAKAKPSAGKKK